MDGFSFDVTLSAVTVFLQGFLSFLSPCVLPLLPLYIGYLSGSAGKEERVRPHVVRMLPRTLLFVLGISFAFFLLGMGMTAVSLFFRGNRALFARLGGVLVILLSLYQLGLFGQIGPLSAEKRLPFDASALADSPLTAFLLGFFFSFAWTPCVGPTLTSVLLLAGSAASRSYGFFLIGVYTLGFCIPFLLTGMFAASLLAFFRRHRGVVQYTVKIGGVLMLVLGLMMVSGRMDALSLALANS